MTEEPVWVWDASARRILWANHAGRRFWGVDTLDSLRAKRFSSRSKSVERLTSLASRADGQKEWVETLTLNAAFGRRPVRCYMQGLEVAGGRPGLIVKALDHSGRSRKPSAANGAASRERDPPGQSRPSETDSDQAALKALGARVQQAAKSRRERMPVQTEPPPRKDADSPGPDLSERTVREFCHEMRNPLSVILGFAERIKQVAPAGKTQDQLVAYADDIMEGAQLAMAVLGDFSARMLCPDRQPEAPEPVDIRATVESCLRLIAPLASASGIRIYRRTESRLPRLFTGERVLKQILLNLLMNAVRHHKTGGEIRVTVRQRKDGTVRLAVKDNGHGMTKKEIRAALANAHAPRPPKQGRSGLGLPLVKRLVEEIGGRIAIDSKRGQGTTVEILIPGRANGAP